MLHMACSRIMVSDPKRIACLASSGPLLEALMLMDLAVDVLL